MPRRWLQHVRGLGLFQMFQGIVSLRGKRQSWRPQRQKQTLRFVALRLRAVIRGVFFVLQSRAHLLPIFLRNRVFSQNPYRRCSTGSNVRKPYRTVLPLPAWLRLWHWQPKRREHGFPPSLSVRFPISGLEHFLMLRVRPRPTVGRTG